MASTFVKDDAVSQKPVGPVRKKSKRVKEGSEEGQGLLQEEDSSGLLHELQGEQPIGTNGPKKKRKMNQIIKNFVHHVCSPISIEKRRKAVTNILSPHHNFNSSDLDDLWKGMFFVIWYTEIAKCEEIVYDIAYGCHLVNEKEYLLAGFKLLAREWMGIDFYRIDKYALLVRHMINRSLRIAILEDEPRDFDFLSNIYEIAGQSVELFTHIVEVYLEELKNVTTRKVIWNPKEKSDVYLSAFKPVIKAMKTSNDARTLNTIKEFIFDEIKEILSSDCESRWKRKFYQDVFRELINTGKGDDVCLKNRKILFEIASGFKETCDS